MVLNYMFSCKYFYYIFIEASSLVFDWRKVVNSIIVDVSFL